MIYENLLLDNRYRVIKKLGQGAFGETWEVDDRGVHKVLKVLAQKNSKALEFFSREAEALKRFKHPGIPQVDPDCYFVYTPPNSESIYCLVMEKIDGCDLKQWLDQHHSLTECQAIEWLRQLVEILTIIHDQNYFHRDIKPANIMLRNNGQLVLIDFGTVRHQDMTFYEKLPNCNITRVFTPEYAPREQIWGQAFYKSDFFSLGVTFIQLLTGRSPEEFNEDIVTGRFQENWRDSVPYISKELGDLIDEMIEPDPSNRPDNANLILFRLNLMAIKAFIDDSLRQLPQPMRQIGQGIFRQEYQRWLQKIRTPKIALYGRSGSGKSSLINAILGKQVAKVSVAEVGTLTTECYSRYREGWELKFVDSRGIGDYAGDAGLRQAIDDITGDKIDILLFVIPIEERAIYHDREFLQSLKRVYQDKYKENLPVILVCNKIDKVKPDREWSPPYDLDITSTSGDRMENGNKHKKKESNIRECIRSRLKEYQNLIDVYVPVCAWWDEDDDERYNIEVLVRHIYELIPDQAAKNGFGGATADQPLKKAIAGRLTWLAAFCAFVMVMSFRKANDIANIQNSLVNIIAQLARFKRNQEQEVKRFLQHIGIVNSDARESAFPITLTLGQAAIRFFIEGEDINQVRQVYNQEKQQATSDFQSACQKGPQEAWRKIEQMKTF